MNEKNKLYQLTCHISPIISDNILEELVKKIKDLFAADNVLLISENDLSTEKISKRKLAYPIKKFKESFYLVINFLTDSQAVNGINRQISLEKNIIRHMITNIKKPAAAKGIIDYKATEQIESLSKDDAAGKLTKNAKKTEIIDKITNPPEKLADSIQESKVEIDKLDQKLEEILNQ